MQRLHEVLGLLNNKRKGAKRSERGRETDLLGSFLHFKNRDEIHSAGLIR